MGSPGRFFQREDVKNTIDQLGAANCRRLVIVVGAGASAESGLPLWDELIRRLLTRAVEVLGRAQGADDAARLADDLLEREGNLLSAATMAKVALGPAFPEELGKALYEYPGDQGTYAPGPLARAVARTVKVFKEKGHFIEVITTNYDTYIEQALKDEGLRHIRSLLTNTGPADPGRDVVVRHAHGLVPPEGAPRGDVVLTESDYHRTGTESWQEQYFRDRLDDSHVLFVGASLTDLNLLRFLSRYRHRSDRVHAVLVRSPDATRAVDIDGPRDRVASLHEDIANDRWRSLGVNVLFADHYSQPSQFVFEVAQRKAVGGTYVPYGERLDSWYRACAEKTLGLTAQSRFAEAQLDTNEIAREILDVLVAETGLSLRRREMLSLHLWVRSPSGLRVGRVGVGRQNLDSLAMLICSDREWSDPRAADRKLVMLPTSRAAVEAFCHGAPQIHQQPIPTYQWNFVLAVPIVLDLEQGRLPVGAATINSNLAGNTSCLARLRDGDWPAFVELVQYLQGWGAFFLNPPPN